MKKQNNNPEEAASLRQKAEEQLKFRTDKARLISTDTTTGADKLKLIHELEVHQIELEMQNEELVIAKEKAELAEEKLKTSDRIFKHSLDMLCIAGFDGYFKVLNPAWTKILGWSNEELLSKPWIDFVHPDDIDNTKNIKAVIVNGKEVYQFENRYMCKDSTIKWLSWNSFPYPEENIMFGVARDVTISKQRELILNNFFEQPLNLNLIADFEGRIHKVNSAWEIYLGYQKDEIIGRIFFDFIHPDDISTTIKEMKNLEKGIATFHFENRYRHKNGEYRNFAWSAITSLDEHLVYAVAIDITERQQVEEALRRSEAIKNAMVSNIGDVIVIIDQNRINQYKSPNVTKLFGYKPEELIGKITWDNVYPDDLEAAQDFLDSVAAEPNAAGTTELRYKRKDGDYVWIEISVVNLFHDKDIQGLLGNYHDISERKRAGKELMESEEMLRNSQSLAHICAYSTDLNLNEIGKSTWKCSPEFYKIFGIDVTYPHTIEDWAGFIHPDCREEIFAYHQYVVNERIPFNKEYKIIRINDGVERWVHGTGSLVYNEKGIPIRMHGAIQDITERKQSENTLLEKIDELERFFKITVGRETSMIALKKEVNNLLKKLGQDNKYTIHE